MKTYSILGLVLMIVSALVEAAHSAKKAPVFVNCNGLCVRTYILGLSYTCQPAASGPRNCFSTVESGGFSVTNDVGVTVCPGGPNPTTVEDCIPVS